MAELPTLPDHIDMQIRANGPMSLATYMGLCMTHPREGYYKKARPLGADGDFITAPEISQMFGELIGFFFVNLWQQMNEPKSFTLLELGPGRGTLMQDALRVASRADGFANALHLQLFETHPDLKAEQAKRLSKYTPYWAGDIDAVSDDPLFVVANEFFDALPIRQFVKREQGWHERMIGLKDGKRAFGLSPTPVPEASMPESIHNAAIGEVYEANLAARDVMQKLARIVARQGGAILAIDYGYAKTQTGETLQAVSRHTFADPLEAPGEADLSAHVDFGSLGDAAKAGGLVAHRVTPQGEFLKRLGILERTEMLTKSNPGEADNIKAALHRLTDSSQMGDLFKAFVAASPGLEPPGLMPGPAA